jgi:hypothetical protein
MVELTAMFPQTLTCTKHVQFVIFNAESKRNHISSQLKNRKSKLKYVIILSFMCMLPKPSKFLFTFNRYDTKAKLSDCLPA